MLRLGHRSPGTTCHARSAKPRTRKSPQLEELESRCLLSGLVVPPQLIAHPEVGPPNVVLNQTAFTPSQIRHAYGFDQITFTSGHHTVAGDGRGQTIAIVDAFDDPNIASDLALFDQTYGLPAPPSFTKLDQFGGTNYPAGNTSWPLETSLDVEWSHAVAPGANIVLVEANSASFPDMMTAVDTARHLPGVSVVSMSWGLWEAEVALSYSIPALDAVLTTPSGHSGITFVASAGDTGSAQAPEWPSISPNVLSVGGTTLTKADSNGTYGSETAWTLGGGGIGTTETEPSWQQTVQSTGRRTNPDVSYNGDPQTGYAVYDSIPYSSATGSGSGWWQVGGTSAGSPQWSALLAIANQGRALTRQGPLNQAQVIMYSLSTADFHDITTGTNGYPADTGYDLATGIGTPIANVVVRDLVLDNHVIDLPPGLLPILPFTSLSLTALGQAEGTGAGIVFTGTAASLPASARVGSAASATVSFASPAVAPSTASLSAWPSIMPYQAAPVQQAEPAPQEGVVASDAHAHQIARPSAVADGGSVLQPAPVENSHAADTTDGWRTDLSAPALQASVIEEGEMPVSVLAAAFVGSWLGLEPARTTGRREEER